MKVQKITEVKEFQFFLFYQIYSRSEKYFNTEPYCTSPRPIRKDEEYFIGAFPEISFKGDIEKEIKGLDYFEKTIIEGYIEYDIYEKESFLKRHAVKISFEMRPSAIIEFLDYVNNYQLSKESDSNKIVNMSELNKLFKLARCTLRFN